jgi:hypothetical protein
VLKPESNNRKTKSWVMWSPRRLPPRPRHPQQNTDLIDSEFTRMHDRFCVALMRGLHRCWYFGALAKSEILLSRP